MKKVAEKKVKVVKKTATKTSKAKVVKKTSAETPKTKVVKRTPKLPEVILKAIKFLDDKKAESIVILDLRKVANISEYFVVATAANAPHLKSLSDGLQRLFKNEQYEGYRVAGTGDSGWIIADYDAVMVHVFSAEMRALYDLEKLWKDAKRIELKNIE